MIFNQSTTTKSAGLPGATTQPTAATSQPTTSAGEATGTGLFGVKVQVNPPDSSSQTNSLFGGAVCTEAKPVGDAPATTGQAPATGAAQTKSGASGFGAIADSTTNASLFGGTDGKNKAGGFTTPVVDLKPGEIFLGRKKPGEPDQVTLSTRPTVRDIARLHPDFAGLIQGLHDWFNDNDDTLAKIKAGFADVSRVADGAFSSTTWKASDANLMGEQLEQAEELLEYTEPSVARLARITECLVDDFARLDSGLKAVPPQVESSLLLEEFIEKKQLLEKTIDYIERAVERAESRESDEEKLNHFRLVIQQEDEAIERLNTFLNAVKQDVRLLSNPL